MEDPKDGEKKKIRVDLPEIGFPPRKDPVPVADTPKPEEPKKEEPKIQEPLESKTPESVDTKQGEVRERSPAGLIITVIVLIIFLLLSIAGNIYLAYDVTELKTMMNSDARAVEDIITEKEDMRKAKESLERKLSQLKGATTSLSSQFNDLKKDKESLVADLISNREKNVKLEKKMEEYGKEIAKLKNSNSKYKNALQKEKGNAKKLARVIKEQEDKLKSLKAKIGTGDFSNNYEASHLYELGYLYARADMFDKAIDKFKRFIAISGENAEAYFNIAYIHEHGLRNRNKAIKYYKKYLALTPDAEDLYEVKNKIESLERVGAKRKGSNQFKINLDKLKY